MRLCWFHICQAARRWMTLRENGVQSHNRQEIILLLQMLYHANFQEEAEELYQRVVTSIYKYVIDTNCIV